MEADRRETQREVQAVRQRMLRLSEVIGASLELYSHTLESEAPDFYVCIGADVGLGVLECDDDIPAGHRV